jgi:hypothetical protein
MTTAGEKEEKKNTDKTEWQSRDGKGEFQREDP